MDRRKPLLFFGGMVLWGLVVAALLVYLFFPYQKVLRIALQGLIGGGKAAVSMEGVKTRTFGVTAKKLLLKPDAASNLAPFELSDVDISWSPLALFKGNLSLDSTATLFKGTLHSVIEGISFPGPSTPSVLLSFKGIDMAKCPEGILPWFKGVTGTLNGTIRKDIPLATPDRQSGDFRFTLKNGEVKDLQIRNIPRLIIPYRDIVIDGRVMGPRVEIKKILLRSDVVSLNGSGQIDTADTEQNVNITLSYEALSKALPLKGKGTISIRGDQTAPLVTISTPDVPKSDRNVRS